MLDINFSIEKFSLKINDFAYKGNNQKSEFYVLGDLIGLILDENVYKSSEAFEIIMQNVDDLENLKKILRNSVGSFFLIIKNQTCIQIFCSCSSPGLIYKKEEDNIFFSSSESKSYVENFKLNHLDENELLSQLISHPIFRRVPFKTLFKNLSRCPSGCFLEIQQNLDINENIFIIDNKEENYWTNYSSMRKKFYAFSFLLENIIKLICDYYKEYNKTLLKSGGIDSAALLTALDKSDYDFQAVHFGYHGKESEAEKLAKDIVSHSKKNLKIIYPYSVAYEDLVKIAKTNLNGLVGMQYLKTGTHKLSKKKKMILISGQNLDTLYYVDTFGPNSMSVGSEKLKKIVFNLKKRIFFSFFFFRVMSNRYLQKFIILLNNQYSFEKYIESILCASIEHAIPFKKSEHEGLRKQVNSIYFKYRKINLFEVIKDHSMTHFRKDLEELDAFQKNHIVRVSRWMRTVQNVSSNYHALSNKNHLRLIPFTEGPFASFFLKYKLSFFEMFFIKILIKKYFKNYFGKGHYFFALSVKFKSFFKRINDIGFKVWLKNKFFRNKNLKIVPEFQEELEILRKIFRKNSSDVLAKSVKNELIKNYLNQIKNNLFDKNKNDWTKFELMELCRYINYEIYFSNISKNK